MNFDPMTLMKLMMLTQSIRQSVASAKEESSPGGVKMTVEEIIPFAVEGLLAIPEVFGIDPTDDAKPRLDRTADSNKSAALTGRYQIEQAIGELNNVPDVLDKIGLFEEDD